MIPFFQILMADLLMYCQLRKRIQIQDREDQWEIAA